MHLPPLSLRGDRKTTQTTNAYNSVVRALVKWGKRVDIPRRTVELLLTVEFGPAKEDTIEKHVRLMVDLGYLKMSLSPPHGAASPKEAWGFGKEGMMYDLVEKKLEEIKRARAFERKAGIRKEGPTRR